MKSRAALYAFLGALLVGGLLRFADIQRRPLHHDEGVNGLFLLELVRQGKYRYDPSNYHGPLLYFMVAPLLKVLDMQTVVLRLWPAAIGTATLAVFFPLRALIGEWGAVAAAWLLAVSPCAVYFSRDCIHETWFVAAAALVAGAAGRYLATRQRYLLVLVWLGAALLVATKETAPFEIAALGTGFLLAGLAERGPGVLRIAWRDFQATRSAHAWGVITATAVLVVLFTSFFTNPQGFLDMFRAYAFWAKTGTEGSGHEKPWPYFFDILWRYERAAWVLGIVGLVVALLRRERALLFGVAGAVLLGIHAVIPYKTPWLVIGALPWLAASAGYLVDRALGEARSAVPRLLVAVCLTGAVGAAGHEAWRLSYQDYDDDREAIVYSQTLRGFLDLVRSVRAVADTSGLGSRLPLQVISQDHFPLNWYTRDMTSVGYGGGVPEDPKALILFDPPSFENQRASLVGSFRMRTFPLRPGVDLILVIPGELFDKARGLIPEPGRWARAGTELGGEPLPGSAAPERLEAGLLARGYLDGAFGGQPVFSVPRPVYVDADHGDNRDWSGVFGIEWTGYLLAIQEGIYRFALESDDGSTLVIDGETIIDNWGRHAERRRTGAVRLAAGQHRVAVRYIDYGGGAKLRWKWTPPDGRPEEPVPPLFLSHAPEGR